MVFSSALFLVYFLPVFFLLYYVVPHRWRNAVALVASVLFYTWGGADFALILFASTVFDFFLTRAMEPSEGFRRKALVLLSVVLNFGLLAYFKYADFFVANFNWVTGSNSALPKIILPLGISFFTFHKVSYVLDVYFRKAVALKKLSDLLLYILLFPQLVAGPIIRFNEIASQILDRRSSETVDNHLAGLFRFVIGLSKKVLLADVLGREADKLFALPHTEIAFLEAWAGALAYTFQIYFDFSGYSDMACGLGRMMGFKFPENFDMPYIASNITEFWRRWHITLSNWMRDYLYIPLGGNRGKAWRTYFNLWVVFFFSGLWHGASWNFVLWGAYHGFFIAAERLFSRITGIPTIREKKNVFRVLINFAVVVFGWVLFRADSFATTQTFYNAMLFPSRWTSYKTPLDAQTLSIFVLCLFLVFLPVFTKVRHFFTDPFHLPQSRRRAFVLTAVLFIVYLLALGEVLGADFSPFIYFRF